METLDINNDEMPKRKLIARAVPITNKVIISKQPIRIQDKFWTNASGSYKIDTENLLKFLNDRGYYVFNPQGIKTNILIKLDNKVVIEVSAKEIRRVCWDYINTEYLFTDTEESKQVKTEFYKSQTLVSKSNLELLPVLDLKECKDTPELSYLFFKDFLLAVTADSIQIKNYDQINGIILQSDICNKNICSALNPDQITIRNYIPSGEFFEFIKSICIHEDSYIETTSLNSLISIIGYLTHRYKDPAITKAIIFMDSYEDLHENGGTGKGVLIKGLGYVRETAYQDGKLFKSSDKFAFSNVNYGTRLLVIDDVPRDFDFKKMFPIITERAVIEKKYENKIVVPYEESPKIIITTNYIIEGNGKSHKRRKVEFILSKTFNDEYTPEDKFGHLLYVDWDDNEWGKFYLFIAHCLQKYLQDGIVKPKFNIAERKLIIETSEEFRSFMMATMPVGRKINKTDFYNSFYSKCPNHIKIELTTFRHWLKYFADAYDFKFFESHSGNDNFFEFNI